MKHLQIVFSGKDTSERFSLPDFKIYSKDALFKTLKCWGKVAHKEQRKRVGFQK